MRINQKHDENCRYFGSKGKSPRVEGGFNMNQMEGFCKRFTTWCSQDLIFEGYYKLGKKHGYGKEYSHKGEVLYEGQFIEGFTEAEYQKKFPKLNGDLFYKSSKQVKANIVCDKENVFQWDNNAVVTSSRRSQFMNEERQIISTPLQPRNQANEENILLSQKSKFVDNGEPEKDFDRLDEPILLWKKSKLGNEMFPSINNKEGSNVIDFPHYDKKKLPIIQEKTIPEAIIYTDGGFDKQPYTVSSTHVKGKFGGWGYFRDDKDSQLKNNGKYGWGPVNPFSPSQDYKNSATRCEIVAAIEALKKAKNVKNIKIYSDCKNLVNAIENGTVFEWKKSGYSDRYVYQYGDPVEKFNNHKELWLELLELIKDYDFRALSESKQGKIDLGNQINWQWVKSHQLDPKGPEGKKFKYQGNVIANEMAFHGKWMSRNQLGEMGKFDGPVNGKIREMIGDYDVKRQKAIDRNMFE